MRSHELVLIFYKRLPVYNPQGIIPVENAKHARKSNSDKEYAYPVRNLSKPYVQRFKNYPRSVMTFANINAKTIHPTQKPLEMFKYFILTYTNPDAVVLDTCIGSGTTAIAALETGRFFVGFETDERYFKAVIERINAISKR